MDEFTNTAQEAEIRRCAESFVYFCDNYVKIGPEKKKFDLYSYQRRYIEALQQNRKVIAKTFRQGGFTTLNIAYLVWRCLFNQNETNAYVVGRDLGHWARFDCNILLDQLPNWAKDQVTGDWRFDLVFKSGSRLLFRAPNACRGSRLHHVVLDQAAFWDHAEDQWKTLYPAVADGKVAIISTPNGKSGRGKWFYDMYSAAERAEIGTSDDLSNFTVFYCNYWENPTYHDEERVANIKSSLGPKAWREEILCEFVDDQETNAFERRVKQLSWNFDKLCEETQRKEKFTNQITDSERKALAVSASQDDGKFVDMANAIWFRHSKLDELEQRIHEWTTPQMLIMAGMITCDEAKDMIKQEIILDEVIRIGTFPKNMQLAFREDHLCVNEVPTRITLQQIETCYNNLVENGHEDVTTMIAESIEFTLSAVFGESKNESLVEETFSE